MTTGIIYGELFFIGMLFFRYSFQYKVVHPGPCLEYGSKFCEEKVANSFCLKKKNKCYCKPQYVDLKEPYGITCKPLLTNLKCNTDKNCRDVEGSVCHPGAGACTCPYNTIYVPQLHSCKKQAFEPNNRTIQCIKCKEVGGECFIQTSQNQNLPSNHMTSVEKFFPQIGCSCPGITTTQIEKYENSYDAVCSQILVDIGQPCNDRDLICRSSKALCMKSIYFSYSICNCPPSYIAVYQEYLGYHECYSSSKLNVNSCRLCLRTNGLCFDMNADEQPDGCHCGRLKLVQEDFKALNAQNDQNSLQQACSKNIVEILCWPENLRICYYPPKIPNIAKFIENLSKQRALIFISNGNSLSNENDSGPLNDCLLTIDEIHRSRENKIRFCIDKQMNTLVPKLPCGVTGTKYSNGYLYSGYVEVWMDKYFPDPITDQLIDFSCKCDYSFLRVTPGQAIDRSWSTENPKFNNVREMNITAEFFNFSILNVDGTAAQTVLKMAPIKLYAVLNTEANEYISVAPESCWCINSTDDVNLSSKWKLINRGCIESRSGFTTPFLHVRDTENINVSDRKPFTELASGFFPAFTMFESSQVVFKCLFRFCKNKQWCLLKRQCSEENPEFIMVPPPRKFDDIRFSLKTFKISVLPIPKVDSVPHGGVKSVCSFFWCLPGDKLLLVISLLTVILLLVTTLAFVLFRRHNQLVQYRSTTLKETNSNISKVKHNINNVNNNNQIIHGYYPVPNEIWKIPNYTMCSCIEDYTSIPKVFCKDHINADICVVLNSDTLMSTKSIKKDMELDIAHSINTNDLNENESQSTDQNIIHMFINSHKEVDKDVESTDL